MDFTEAKLLFIKLSHLFMHRCITIRLYFKKIVQATVRKNHLEFYYINLNYIYSFYTSQAEFFTTPTSGK